MRWERSQGLKLASGKTAASAEILSKNFAKIIDFSGVNTYPKSPVDALRVVMTTGVSDAEVSNATSAATATATGSGNAVKKAANTDHAQIALTTVDKAFFELNKKLRDKPAE